MSLLGSLNLGSQSLAAQQAGLQVTGNNIANAGTPGYTRESARILPSDPVSINNALYGTGAEAVGVDRQANEALNASLRSATSDQSAAQSTSDYLNQLQTTFGALNDNDLSSQMSSFFNSFSTLATNPQNSGQRAVVLQTGVALASYVQNLRGQLSTVQTNATSQIQTLTKQANDLVQSIGTLNGKIAVAESSGGSAGSLRDQRDQDLSDLSKLVDIRTIQQPNGQFNVLTGSVPLVEGTHTRSLTTLNVPDSTGKFTLTQLSFADDNSAVPASSGQIAATQSMINTQVNPAITTLDTYANNLINTVNTIHSQGQGLTGFRA